MTGVSDDRRTINRRRELLQQLEHEREAVRLHAHIHRLGQQPPIIRQEGLVAFAHKARAEYRENCSRRLSSLRFCEPCGQSWPAGRLCPDCGRVGEVT